MEKIEVVGAAIVEGTLVLAAQRSESMSEPLKWEFPGGKVETGETHKEALQREIYEELNIKIRIQDFIGTGNSLSKDREIALHVYMAVIIENKPIAKEHSALKWVEANELESLDWAEADIPIVAELTKRFGF